MSEKFRILFNRIRGGHVRRANFVYASSSIICQILRFGGVIFSTRILNPAEFGIFAQAILAVALASIIRELGQTNGLIAYDGTDSRYARFHFQSQVLLTLLGIAGLCAVFNIGVFSTSQLRPVLPLLGGIMLSEALSVTGSTMCLKQFRFRFLALVDVGSVLCWITVLYALSSFQMNFMILLWARLAESTFRAILILVGEGYKYIRPVLDTTVRDYYMGKFVRYSAPDNIVTNFGMQIDTFLLNILCSLSELGLYERIQQLIRIPLSLSINLLDKVALASFSTTKNDISGRSRLLFKYLAFTLIMVSTSIVFITIFFKLIFTMLIGENWSDSLFALWLFAIPLMITRPLSWTLSLFFRGTGRVKEMLNFSVCTLLLKIALAIPLTMAFGARGMLLALGISSGLMVFHRLKQIQRQNAITP